MMLLTRIDDGAEVLARNPGNAPIATLAWNAAGGTLWAGAFVLLGYIAGSQYQRVAHNASLFGLALLALIVIVIVAKKLHSRHKAKAGSPA